MKINIDKNSNLSTDLAQHLTVAGRAVEAIAVAVTKFGD